MRQDSEIDALTEKVIGCAIKVHETLGPGLLESIYCACLAIELMDQGLHLECERPIVVTYRGKRVVGTLKLDIVVEGSVVIEVKAVERLHPVHQAQLITYLKLANLPAGLLMNFNDTTLKAGLKRVDHPSRYFSKRPCPIGYASALL
jgi:GxxExxY protein